jgi:quercetin dioxygenase-like cupin family protein
MLATIGAAIVSRDVPLHASIEQVLASLRGIRQNRPLASRETDTMGGNMVHLSKTFGAVSGAALFAFAGIIVAQNPGLTRTIVTKADVSVPEREAVVARVEVAPGGVAGWHTHPGDEISYVTEGEATLIVAGQPPRKVAAGEAFVIPAGVVHNAKNDGAIAIKLIGVYVVEKGKPLASPAQALAQ